MWRGVGGRLGREEEYAPGRSADGEESFPHPNVLRVDTLLLKERLPDAVVQGMITAMAVGPRPLGHVDGLMLVLKGGGGNARSRRGNDTGKVEALETLLVRLECKRWEGAHL